MIPLASIAGGSSIELSGGGDDFIHDGAYVLRCRPVIHETRPQRELAVERCIRQIYPAAGNQAPQDRLVVLRTVAEGPMLDFG